MKEKCPDIDTSSKTIEIDTKAVNYEDFDISSLEKEYRKRIEEFQKRLKNKKKEEFKNVKISTENPDSKIELEYEKNQHRPVFQMDEPLYKSHLGVIIAFFLIIIITLIIVLFISNHYSKANLSTNENINNKKISKSKIIYLDSRFQLINEMHNFTKEELKNITVHNLTSQLYIDLCLQGILINKNIKNLKLSKSPKISVIKPIFNVFDSLKYLNYSLRSIQNQNFTDIEIIIIDDASNDNNQTINYVKKFQKEDPRIKLLINEKERGLLYTICKGILSAKGKYIMELDQDDLFTYGTLFSDLYKEAEKNNLDIISFWGIREKNRYKIIEPQHENIKLGKIIEDKSALIRLSYRKQVLYFLETGMIWNKFVKREVYQKTVHEIGEKYYNRYLFTHEDSILVFMMYRQAKRVKEYRRYGHLKYLHNTSISSEETLTKNKDQYCYEYLTYFDAIIELSGNDVMDKKYAALDFTKRYMEMKDMIGKKNKEFALSVAKKYLNNKYIPLMFINEIKRIYNEILNLKVE